MLPVTYRGVELEFPIKLVLLGHTRGFIIQISEVEIVFEKDESWEYRAIVDENVPHGVRPEHGLPGAIADVLTTL